METKSNDLWQPIHKFSQNAMWQDLDWAVQAQIRVQISAHLYSNMKALLKEGFTLAELEEITSFLGLSPHLSTHYLLHSLALRQEEFADLYALEQELWRLFPVTEHDGIVTQALDLLTRRYQQEFSGVIKRHLLTKNKVAGDFKNWFLHDGFKELVRLQHRSSREKERNLKSSKLLEKVMKAFSGVFELFC